MPINTLIGDSENLTTQKFTLWPFPVTDGTAARTEPDRWRTLGINVKEYGATGDGNTDDTDAIAAAIAAIPSSGARLYFPAGHYVTTGGFVLAYPTLVIGDGFLGMSTGSPTISGWGSRIDCTSTTAKLFTVNSMIAKFMDIALVNTTNATSGSSAIYVDSSDVGQQVNYHNITTWGFYDAVDVKVGQAWVMQACNIFAWKHWGVRVRNTAGTDYGDWTICNNNILSASGAAACIRYESSGGGRILNNKLQVIGGAIGTLVNGISMDASGSRQTLIIGNSIENVTSYPIEIVTGWAAIIISNNYILGNGVPAIYANYCEQMIITGNVLCNMSSTATVAAIELGSGSANSVIGPNQIDGFIFDVDITATGRFITLQSLMPVDLSSLPDANCFEAGSTAIITDLAALTFGATAEGNGELTGPVFSNGTNWIVG